MQWDKGKSRAGSGGKNRCPDLPRCQLLQPSHLSSSGNKYEQAQTTHAHTTGRATQAHEGPSPNRALCISNQQPLWPAQATHSAMQHNTHSDKLAAPAAAVRAQRHNQASCCANCNSLLEQCRTSKLATTSRTGTGCDSCSLVQQMTRVQLPAGSCQVPVSLQQQRVAGV